MTLIQLAQCALIKRKTEFFRCSVCKNAYYWPLTGAQAINNPVINYPLPVFVRKSTVESTAEILSSIQFTAERLGTRSKRDTSF
jgi:hypothetical protein